MVVAAEAFELLRAGGLDDVDPALAALLERELERQRDWIDLIASENYAPPSSFSALGSVAANKLAEGYPGRRGGSGCEVVDEIERAAIDRAKALFGAEHANVQPLSGAIANVAVYLACLEPGNTVLAMRPDQGGHTTHGLPDNVSGRFYRFVHYGVDRETGLIDFDEVFRLAREHRPKLIVFGGTAYPRRVDPLRFRAVADEVGALLLCDMAHFAGLVAAGLHPNPTPHCDFVTSTVHKTLSGPRSGAFVLCKAEHAEAVDRGVYPGIQAAPLCETTAAKALCFRIAATDAFRAYQARVRANADALAAALLARGLALVTGGTETHLLVVDLRRTAWSGRGAQARLEELGIATSLAPVPYDEVASGDRSGLRLGTLAVTMRGFAERDTAEVGSIVADALGDEPDLAALRARCRALCEEHPLYPGFRGFAG